MPVVQLPPEILRLGHPTPFSLRDASGHLLVAKGVVLTSEVQRQKLISREVFVDESEGELLKRAMAGKVYSLLEQNTVLGKIAQAHPDAADLAPSAGAKVELNPLTAWAGLQMRCSGLLRDPAPADFLPRLQKLQHDVLELLNSDVDLSLLVLVHAAGNEIHHYSATHALLVTVLCDLATRQLPDWTEARRESQRCAALTMNLSMSVLQDTLALQDTVPSAQQRAQIVGHSARAVACLSKAGVSDALWLDAVEHHHDKSPGPLAALAPALQMGRLLERADIFAARLSSRKMRPAQSAAAAAKATYLDEHQQADEAGAAIIKAVGIHPPGSYVRLSSGELALVLRRGVHAKSPKVASVISRSGTPLGEPALRDTRLRAHEVTGGVAPHEVKVRLNLEKLLKLA
ncbi:MAG TPA: phosphohydrolase [Rhizobacter sp.]|nr:phosphohydrolase [Rhizobacter sp.]